MCREPVSCAISATGVMAVAGMWGLFKVKCKSGMLEVYVAQTKLLNPITCYFSLYLFVKI